MSSHNYNDYFFEFAYYLLYHLKDNSQGTADRLLHRVRFCAERVPANAFSENIA